MSPGRRASARTDPVHNGGVDISSIDAAELIIRPKEAFFHASSRAVGRTPEDRPRGVAARDSLRSQQALDDVRNVFRRELRFPRGLTPAEDNSGYFVPLGGGTLVTCDAVQHCADKENASFFGGVMMKMMGFTGGVIVPPMWRRFQKVRGAKVRETLSRILERPFANLVTGHGPPLAGGADAVVRSAIDSASAS